MVSHPSLRRAKHVIKVLRNLWMLRVHINRLPAPNLIANWNPPPPLIIPPPEYWEAVGKTRSNTISGSTSKFAPNPWTAPEIAIKTHNQFYVLCAGEQCEICNSEKDRKAYIKNVDLGAPKNMGDPAEEVGQRALHVKCSKLDSWTRLPSLNLKDLGSNPIRACTQPSVAAGATHWPNITW